MKVMTSIMAVTFNDRTKLVMGCDSMTTHGEYLRGHEDKIYRLGNFLLGAAGDSDKIEEVVRTVQKRVPRNIKTLYQRLACVECCEDESLDFILCGEDRGGLSIYYNESNGNPSRWLSIGQGDELIDYAFLSKYDDSISLNQGLFLVLESLDYLKRFTSIDSPFHLYYYDNPASEPRKVDDDQMSQLTELLEQKKTEQLRLNDEFNDLANKLGL